tara:strand:+ start:228 stop:1094 length:867 start_codon:yes stop_codon:yes gene_type:complete
MLKVIAIPSFVCFYLGASLPFWINIKSDNVAIMTAALVAAMLTYYSSLVTAQNKKKDYREKIIENIVNKGYEVIRKSDLVAGEAISYMPFKEELEKEVEIYVEKNKEYHDKIVELERSFKGTEVERNKIDEIIKESTSFDQKNRKSYNDARKEFNHKLTVFGALHLRCLNIVEDFYDEVKVVDYFYEEKTGKVKEIKKITIQLIRLVEEITDSSQKTGVHYIDRKSLTELSSKQGLLRKLLNDTRRDCLMEFTLVDEIDKRERDGVFMLTVLIFLIGIGFMVSNGFKV